MSETLIFAGPSIHGVDVTRFRHLDFAPPAKCGDLLSAVTKGYRRIGLIDGVFGASAAVWHKEILYGLGKGLVIAGAASMGALRAAECHRFGMVGIGRIFGQYAAGQRNADADVALVHLPPKFGCQPTTVSLVDAEHAIAEMESSGVLCTAETETLFNAVRALNFRERTWDGILAVAGLDGVAAERVLAAVSGVQPVLKARDALALLEQIETLPTALAPNFDFSYTAFFRQLVEEMSHAHD